MAAEHAWTSRKRLLGPFNCIIYKLKSRRAAIEVLPKIEELQVWSLSFQLTMFMRLLKSLQQERVPSTRIFSTSLHCTSEHSRAFCFYSGAITSLRVYTTVLVSSTKSSSRGNTVKYTHSYRSVSKNRALKAWHPLDPKQVVLQVSTEGS